MPKITLRRVTIGNGGYTDTEKWITLPPFEVEVDENHEMRLDALCAAVREQLSNYGYTLGDDAFSLLVGGGGSLGADRSRMVQMDEFEQTYSMYQGKVRTYNPLRILPSMFARRGFGTMMDPRENHQAFFEKLDSLTVGDVLTEDDIKEIDPNRVRREWDALSDVAAKLRARPFADVDVASVPNAAAVSRHVPASPVVNRSNPEVKASSQSKDVNNLQDALTVFKNMADNMDGQRRQKMLALRVSQIERIFNASGPEDQIQIMTLLHDFNEWLKLETSAGNAIDRGQEVSGFAQLIERCARQMPNLEAPPVDSGVVSGPGAAAVAREASPRSVSGGSTAMRSELGSIKCEANIIGFILENTSDLEPGNWMRDRAVVTDPIHNIQRSMYEVGISRYSNQPAIANALYEISVAHEEGGRPSLRILDKKNGYAEVVEPMQRKMILDKVSRELPLDQKLADVRPKRSPGSSL